MIRRHQVLLEIRAGDEELGLGWMRGREDEGAIRDQGRTTLNTSEQE